ncbi:phytanoyl-CoA dioxygenase family protein [Hymenobacter sp. 15J16-1T3B]|uniref:phytanoyl-CoA dioxygenase family protein n=1 Tax=Hymenobacter sp. 15J16-1T3B TaxID=2886941 RepID=UPI001D10DE11|nr:phytanoyl-CoA dioxygenase family protein [Hymenobacter sp. 15J16-1T3B]MCC3156372.1 phytanoyl-CoA dioxygenase family protein [Hymenobacter sp. 15J16-1T3B]
MKVNINNKAVEYRIEGEAGAPDEQVLLASAKDLTAGTAWAADGYTVADFLPAAELQQLQQGLHQLVREFMRNAGLPVADDFDISQYHHAVGASPDLHLAVINQIKEIPQTRLPLPASVLERRVSELCGRPVQALNPWDNGRWFHLRIVRPNQPDNNPLHRDVWLPDYDDCVNIYAPLAGSTANSSLTLVPGSHWWPESRVVRTRGGAVYNGVAFTVPAVKESEEPLQIIRPNPAKDEVLVFSPYLLHGGAVNLNADTTRVSLEMRFWSAD